MKAMTRLGLSAIALLWLTGATLAQTQAHEIRLNFVPDKTSVNFTLGDVLHTVHGSFTAKGGTIQFDPARNKISGEILVDAASGHSGSGGRDKKMHSEVLESARYPEIAFRPDRVEGRVADLGASTGSRDVQHSWLGTRDHDSCPGRDGPWLVDRSLELRGSICKVGNEEPEYISVAGG